MSSLHLQCDDTTARFECGNCGWEGAHGELDQAISDAQERISPGCLAPAGTCPDCTALAYYSDETAPSWSAQGELHKLRARVKELESIVEARTGITSAVAT